MIKIIISLILSLAAFASAMADGRIGKMPIAGVECTYDTTVHRKIGPGMTYTQYQFNSLQYQGRTYKLRAHVIKMDMTNTNNRISTYRAKDDYYQVNTQVQQFPLEQKKGLKPVATMAGLGWVPSNSESTTYKMYEITAHMVQDNIIYYSNIGKSASYYVDADRTAHLSNVQLSCKASSSTGKTFTIGQINHCRDNADASNVASLFCNGMKSWSSNNTKGTDVRLKVLSNEGKIKKGKNSCQVLEVLTGCGHAVSSSECIISLSGAGEDVLKSLSVNETLDLDIEYLDDNDKVLDFSELFYTVYTNGVKDGQVRTWGYRNAAFPCIGVSQDGKTTYLADIEISSYSNAPADCLSYLLQNIGVYNSRWLDGGPSAEMTVDGKWVTINSIGFGFNGRYIPGGIITYSIAPDDSVLTSVELADPNPRDFKSGTIETISLYGYNKYDEMIQSDAQKNPLVQMYYISNNAPADTVFITNGEFHADKADSGFIYIKVKGSDDVKTIPVTITRNRILRATPRTLFTGEGRQCQLSLTLSEGSHSEVIPAEDAIWSTKGSWIVTSCENGLITPGIDGEADVYVTYEGLSDTVNVVVENVSTGDTIYDYTPEIKDLNSPVVRFQSVPYYFVAKLEGEPGAQATVFYFLGDDFLYTESDTIGADGKVTITVSLNYDKFDTYPVDFDGISSSSKTIPCSLTSLVAYYRPMTTDIKGITSTQENKSSAIYSLTGQRLNAPVRGVNIRNGKAFLYR